MTRALFSLVFSCVALRAQTPPVVEQWVEVREGTLPIILTVPHGGSLKPRNVLARRYGVTGMDANTVELSEAISEELQALHGGLPHVISSRLHRTKLDPNRELLEAAQGDPLAEAAWHHFHNSTRRAREAVVKRHGAGLLLDIHGHSHLDQRVELGYLITGEQLRMSDTELNASRTLLAATSIRELVGRSPQTFAQVVRGPQSLGGLLRQRGFRCVPSPDKPAPGALAGYFSGVYDVAAHGSRDGGTVSAIQVECPWNNVRETTDARRRFARALAGALGDYFAVHFGRRLKP